MSQDSSDAPRRQTGLTEAEATLLIAQVGPNVIRTEQIRTVFHIIFETLREPTFVLLLVAAGLYLILGSLGEGLFVSAGALVSLGMVILQETRSEHALQALQALSEPETRVIRNGREQRIRSRELVPGDLMLVTAGERVAADGRITSAGVITVDESLLSGESVPVSKSARISTTPDQSGALVFAGTLVVAGEGMIELTATGMATKLGHIGSSLQSIQPEPTPLQRVSARLVARLGIFSVVICLSVVLAYGILRHDWIAGLLSGITLATAMVPEEFPMVLAIFMALGAWRLAQNKVLVRRAAAVETLGAINFLCVDKTGTLTENRMTVAAIWAGSKMHLPDDQSSNLDVTNVLTMAALSSAVYPVDPMDVAIRSLVPNVQRDNNIVGDTPHKTQPLRQDLLAVINVWRSTDDLVFAAKGAPEAIFRICRLQPEVQQQMLAVVAEMADRGLRVLGVAFHKQNEPAPSDVTDAPFQFAGLIGFRDPVRDGVRDALTIAHQAGISVAMITGDYPATALAIAHEAGIPIEAGVLSGREIAAMDPAILRERCKTVRVFARVMPEQKLALVETLKASGMIVAMTGDGINDAPALKAAQVGLAMGKRGTDVAREAADIVLLDDSFSSIIGGIRLGRRIFANLRKALIFITATHIPIAGLALLPILFALPPLLFPVHVILLELAIDPVCSLVFEAEPSTPEIMRQRPRKNTSLFGRRELLLSVAQGSMILITAFSIYYGLLGFGYQTTEARAAAFIATILGNLTLAFANSAEVGTSFFDARRFVFWSIFALTTFVVTILLTIPQAGALFQITAPPLPVLAFTILAGLAAGSWFGFGKLLTRPAPFGSRRADQAHSADLVT
ncbi:cation-translocating P-type ATPase [Bradyrhizobium sp. 27S5]|uniref:cation-translocating P-type ATPase n=1 Tax=Bradyrhizobium sp. 27S5 TaxID=3139728 RepID=UPI0030CC6E8B